GRGSGRRDHAGRSNAGAARGPLHRSLPRALGGRAHRRVELRFHGQAGRRAHGHPEVSAFGIALRVAHLGAGLALVGIFALSLLAGRSDKPTVRAWHDRLRRITLGLAAFVLLSGLAVLGHQLTVVSGHSVAILESSAWLRLLGQTQFGTVWLLRHALLLLMAALVLLREQDEARPDWLAWRLEAWLLAVLGTGAAAWAGHAVGVNPASAVPALVNALHLVCRLLLEKKKTRPACRLAPPLRRRFSHAARNISACEP